MWEGIHGDAAGECLCGWTAEEEGYQLSWDFSVQQGDDPDTSGNGNVIGNVNVTGNAATREGVLITGVYLEGAGWDRKSNSLREPRAMELVTPMPPILFRPVEARKRTAKGVYACPVYYYPQRTGSEERPSFVLAVDLKTGSGGASGGSGGGMGNVNGPGNAGNAATGISAMGAPGNATAGVVSAHHDPDFWVKRGTAMLLSLDK